MLQAPAHSDHPVLAADAPPLADAGAAAVPFFERLSEQVPETRSLWAVAATGVGCGLLAWLTAIGFDVLAGAPVSFTVPMIAVAIWFGGVRGGTVALVVTLALLITFEFEPQGRPWLSEPKDLARLVGIIAAVGALMLLYAVMSAAALRGRRALARQQELTAAMTLSENRWRTLSATAPALITQSRADDGTMTFANQAFEEYAGGIPVSRDERYTKLVHPDDLAMLSRVSEDLEASGVGTYEARLRRADGQYRWHVGSTTAMRGSDGAPESFVSVYVDVHDRKAAEEALTKRESEFRALVESSPAFVFQGDPQGNLTYASPGFWDFLGARGDAGGGAANVARVLHADDVAAFIETYTKAYATGMPVDIEYRLRRHDGQYRWFLAQSAPVRDASGAITGWVGTAVDIHDRKMAEEELEYRERELQLVVDTAKVYTFRQEPAGRTVYMSPNFIEHTGVKGEHFLDGSWQQLDVIHPDDLPMISASRREGVASGEPWACEFRVRGADGVYRWHLSRVVPERAAEGSAAGWQGVCLEVDALHETRADLELALAAKDEFLGMVSHELRTPITTIAGNAHILLRKYGAVEEEARERALSDISDEAQRLSRIVDNLLSLARLERGEAPEIEPVSLRRTVQQLLASEGKSGMRDYEADVPDVIVMGNQLYIEQVLRNLLSNARKYSPAAQPVTITARADGDHVEVTVADRGIGLDEGEAEQLFDEFYRSERTAGTQGVGIGLAVCKRLVEALGGHIEAHRRQDGPGSEFRFTLPLAGD